MIFLDSDMISYILDGKESIGAQWENVVRGKASIGTTCINVYEILKGLQYKRAIRKENCFVTFVSTCAVFDLDELSVRLAANIYANLRKKGVSIGDTDILIAAIVMANKGTLVTNNTKHFQHIEGLPLENWCE